MCGINGIISFNSEKPSFRFVKRMNQAIYKRGPDEEGIWLGGNVVLGNRRLCIIDLSGGKQPIHNEDDSLIMVFNGEIYNYRRLREQLVNKGHCFRTNTDTEVVIHLFEEKGKKCLQCLDGMFAFAIWDRRKQELFLARDPLGKKPLHWTTDGKTIIFSSEIKGILANRDFKRELDEESLAKYLFYGYVPAPKSIFKNIYKLLPGHWMTVGRDGRITTEKYWEVDFSRKTTLTEEEIKNKTVELLRESVEKRLVADVPLGVFLSGGIDSSLVVAMMAKLLSPSRVKAFTIGFKEDPFDESIYAKRVADFLGIRHYLKIFSEKELLESISQVIDFMDEPMADPSILPTYLLSKFTKQEVKVALSGDGGDENFAGYPKYLAHYLLEKYHLKYFPLSLLSGFPAGKWSKLFRYANYPLELRNQLWIAPFNQNEIQAISGFSPDLSEIDIYNRQFKGSSLADKALFLDQKLTLADLYLVKTDRASMSASLEVRSPFLDRQLVEFCASIPFELKVAGCETKSLLKNIATDFLPREIIYRSKKGFGIPLEKWSKKELRPCIRKYLSKKTLAKDGFFDFQTVKSVVKCGNVQQIWTLLIFQLWKEKWLKN